MLAACRREPVDGTPVWFMRQAGRSLADYRRLRERYGILELAKTPELCAEVTLMPVDELGVDAAVLFADIMLPLEPMGVAPRIEPDVGPIIDHGRSARRRRREACGVVDPAEGVRSRSRRSGCVRRELDGRAAVIGFSGAPFTLACYLIEGRPSRDYAHRQGVHVSRAGRLARPDGRLPTDDDVAYLRAQVEAGAQVVQLFDSWVGGLGPPTTSAFVQPYVRRIFEACGRACRRSTSGPARPRCSSSWPRPAAT